MSEAAATSRGFPILRALLRFARRAGGNWLERHQLPFNFWIHMFGIPLAFVGLLALFFLPWYWGLAGFTIGYLLQWIGHRAEGNDLGEWAGIKRLLGWPYVSISPRWQQPAQTTTPPSACTEEAGSASQHG